MISLWLTLLVAALKMAGTRGSSVSLTLLVVVVHIGGTEGKELLGFIYNQTIQFLDVVGITPFQVVSQGIESINGSSTTMGCTVPLLETINGVTTCGSPGNTGYSYLVDGCSPHVNTHHHDWASQLVTVRANISKHFDFPYALLTFGFDTLVSITEMEIDMFICPDWNINPPYITVVVYCMVMLFCIVHCA